MRILKRPDLTNSEARGETSCKTVSELLLKRPWVITLWETARNGKDDKDGIDMFVRVDPAFLEMVKMGGTRGFLTVQIKSSTRKIKAFTRKYAKLNRLFNKTDKSHLIVVCGMDDPDSILADIVGQMIVHLSAFGVKERDFVEYLMSVGDSEAVVAYEHYKVFLLCGQWYGSRLPPLRK